MDGYGLANLYLKCYLFEAKPDLRIGSVENGAGMQPMIEQPYDSVLKWMLGNIIPYGYIIGIDNQRMVTQHLCIKIMYATSLCLVFISGE